MCCRFEAALDHISGVTALVFCDVMKWVAGLMAFGVVVGAADTVNAYRDIAHRIVAAAMADEEGYARLAELCDRIGNRLSGSEALERAVKWSQAQMRQAGLENVTAIPVKVPHWVRGREAAAIVAPVERELNILGLGGSVGTAGMTAEVVTVASFEELDRLGRKRVAGRIVLYNAPYRGYGSTVAYRMAGPSHAARLGAVGVLVRSVTPVSLATPHTGTLEYDADAPEIPAASVTVEDAEMIARLCAQGEVKLHLEMDDRTAGEAESADVIGEIPGVEFPQEVVVIGGHLDSWDVGQGAQDDGVGVMAALEAASLIHKLGLRPRRTIRVVFFTNEENGGAGAEAYREWIGGRIRTHVAAIEMDGGAERPVGFGFTGTAAELSRLQEAGVLLDGIHAETVGMGGGGADIAPLIRDGVPGLGLRTVGTHYFDWHHSAADTLDKVDPYNFKLNAAALAVMGYWLADKPGRLH
jgi:hypothetical protein